ncbi:hypothetical protein OBK28_12820 [Empedobacter falsenii]|uniref:Lipoprotein n=1 Tax=Empedobacter falsenii TaxID=343874 RepID=A0ABY8VA11_9FLAO|nr:MULTISPECIES: hypothetical protein [Empedobacter]MCA4808266.1 hypothetical protein [Empedobacter stercoris]MDM1543229.1 hypothetical protein [Empedobacter sp. 189-2]QNT14407.1 hypothetical protein HNV03_06865 [Empedobacter stercoris]WIH97987.1 hypothetical protein OBA43_03370 [Empedobacter falsenii]HJD87179.1 hypothetical protein [Empedobacter falsenii]
MKYLYLIFFFLLFFNCKNKAQIETLETSTFRKKNDSLDYFTRRYIDDSTYLENGFTKNHLLKTIDTLRLLGKNKEIGSLIGWSSDLHHVNDKLETVVMSQNIRINGKIYKNQYKVFKQSENLKKGVINNDFSFYYKHTKDSIIVNIPKYMLSSFEKLETYVCILCSDKLVNDFSNKEIIKIYDTVFIDKKVNSSSTSKYLFFDPKNIKQNQNCYFQVLQKQKKDNTIIETTMYFKK